MHYIDADAASWEKARTEVRKNAMSCIEQILEATPHKHSSTATYLPSLKLSK